MKFLSKTERILINKVKEANQQFHLWKKGDSLLIGISGGKDSLALLKILSHFDIELFAVHIQLGNEFDIKFAHYCNELSHFEIIESNIYEKINNPNLGKKPCFVCSRMRRKLIMEYAERKNIKKVVFGHHKDDVIETILLNMFYSREISTMMPKQMLFDGRYALIRPFYFVDEYIIKRFDSEESFPKISHKCKFEDLSKRMFVKNLISQLNKENRQIRENIFKSIFNVNSDYLPKK